MRNRRGVSSWNEFETLLASSVPGNNGILGYFLPEPEITPMTTKPGIRAFASCSSVPIDLSDLPSSAEVRAVIESQCMSMRIHSERLGIQNIQRLIVTGGGSASDGVLQVLADVFNVQVWRHRTAVNSAALGAAFRAHHGYQCAITGKFVPFDVTDALQLDHVASPINPDVYNSLLQRTSNQ